MGAADFFVRGTGASLAEAFSRARADAQYESGHGGYTGTIAEKGDVVEITPPPGIDPRAYAHALVDEQRSDEMPPAKFKVDYAKINDKWGPAGAIKTADGWIFFGWASS